ncbi:hypothetical protein BaRGS_00004007 [Batillaria attramentaria]|uniref:Uncharacterized protein n=1 Tax=Batillaria attramentaria TaxID=370345 RepID=A0ABD0LZ37_9CAEN
MHDTRGRVGITWDESGKGNVKQVAEGYWDCCWSCLQRALKTAPPLFNHTLKILIDIHEKHQANHTPRRVHTQYIHALIQLIIAAIQKRVHNGCRGVVCLTSRGLLLLIRTPIHQVVANRLLVIREPHLQSPGETLINP